MNTAEDEEQKRRIESDENKTVYERFKGVGCHSSEELEKMVLESQINQEILTRILDKKDELIKAQEEYISFISDEYDLVFPIAQVHGFYCNEKTIAKGESLRKRISELKGKQS